MWIFVAIILGTFYCTDTNSISQYVSSEKSTDKIQDRIRGTDASKEQTSTSTEPNVQRRYWLVTSKLQVSTHEPHPIEEDEKDASLKSKIETLVEQTVHDTERKLRVIQRMKELNKNGAAYKIGFVLSLVKKHKDLLNELFNIAVKHRDNWKALDQLKVFEFIVHTNVDTTNLVRQMIEMHIQYMNATNTLVQRNRVVLL